MLDYTELYEYLRKEKYAEQLQQLPADFVKQFSEYMHMTKKQFSDSTVDSFSDDILREKKQYENAMAIFKELMLRRKKKILHLVFVAAETGIMKRDFNDMLGFEQNLFEHLVRAVDDAEVTMNEEMNGKPLASANRMIVVKENVEEFVDMKGETIGPYIKGALVNLDAQVAAILVESGKAMWVDES